MKPKAAAGMYLMYPVPNFLPITRVGEKFGKTFI
jgi:hypothetical protein